MAAKKIGAPKNRYGKINALLKRRLIRPSLFSNEAIEQHELRSRRQADGLHLPENVDDVETPDDCWERAGVRISRLDPEMEGARAVLKSLMGKR